MTNTRAKIREITSPTNSLLKVFRRALKEGVTRDGWLAVEGPHLIDEALKPGSRGVVRSLLLGESAAEKFGELRARLPAEAETARVSDALFRQVAPTETPQGIAALVELAAPDLDSLLSERDAMLVVACGVQDPGNLGTMLRSATALGATALLTLKETVNPFNPKAVRASAGAIFQLPVVASLEARDALRKMHEKGIRLIAAERESPSRVTEADLRGTVAFLIGREGSGLDPELSRQADVLLSIPIRSGSDSLNASTAAAIFLYEAARQRGFKY